MVHQGGAARQGGAGDPAPGHPSRIDPLRSAFWGYLADDLNAPRALSVVWDALRSPDLTAADRWSFLADVDRALGFGLAHATDPDAVGTADVAADPRLAALVADRDAARAARDFATADRIRDELAAEGFEVVDTAQGTVLRRS